MYETNMSSSNGWGPLWGAVIGGIGGYLVGRNNTFGGSCGGAVVNGGCQTCFQQGEYTGENRAGINFIAQQSNANAQLIREGFAALNQQKINDQANEIAALRTQAIVNAVGCQTNSQLTQVNNTLNSIVTGCGVRSYSSCGCGC